MPRPIIGRLTPSCSPRHSSEGSAGLSGRRPTITPTVPPHGNERLHRYLLHPGWRSRPDSAICSVVGPEPCMPNAPHNPRPEHRRTTPPIAGKTSIADTRHQSLGRHSPYWPYLGSAWPPLGRLRWPLTLQRPDLLEPLDRTGPNARRSLRIRRLGVRVPPSAPPAHREWDQPDATHEHRAGRSSFPGPGPRSLPTASRLPDHQNEDGGHQQAEEGTPEGQRPAESGDLGGRCPSRFRRPRRRDRRSRTMRRPLGSCARANAKAMT